MKKTISMLLVVAMMAFMLVGCAGGSEKLIVATNATFPPYEFYQGNNIIGIDIEIAQAIADKLGRRLEVQDMEFDSIVDAVYAGKAHMGMAAMTVTDERAEKISFTQSYAKGIQVIIVPVDSDIDFYDLTMKKIGVQEATTGDIYATDDFGEDHVVKYSKGSDAVLALISGEIDAVIIDDEPAKAYVAVNEGLKILDTKYVVEDYAACIAQNNPELLVQVNGALQDLTADGTIDKILDKYISSDN